MTSAVERGFRPSRWATALTVVAVPVMLALGTWQVQRLGWKQELIERIEQRAHAAPVPLPAALDDPEAWDFRPVTVTGRFLTDQSMLTLARPQQGRIGYEVVTPLQRADGPPVLVNRGFVPMDRKDVARAAPDGAVTVTGVARLPQPPGWFQPDGRSTDGVWMRLDVPAMAAAAGLPAAAPVVVEQAPTGGVPAGIAPRVELPNNHLQYAFTWYSLAVVLLVIYGLSQWRRRR